MSRPVLEPVLLNPESSLCATHVSTISNSFSTSSVVLYLVLLHLQSLCVLINFWYISHQTLVGSHASNLGINGGRGGKPSRLTTVVPVLTVSFHLAECTDHG